MAWLIETIWPWCFSFPMIAFGSQSMTPLLPESHPAVAKDILPTEIDHWNSSEIVTEFLFQLKWHALFIGNLLAILFQRSILIPEIAISVDRKPISFAIFCNTTGSRCYFRELFQRSVYNLCQLPSISISIAAIATIGCDSEQYTLTVMLLRNHVHLFET